MRLPNLEQYLQALQQPLGQIFDDEELRKGEVECNALGMPRTRSGAFALVFKVESGSRSFAVRCFTRIARESEHRYRAISQMLQTSPHAAVLKPFLLPFVYYAQGLRIQGDRVPFLKMGWSSDPTLGEFMASHHGSKRHLEALRSSLDRLSRALHLAGVAHGDVQPGNILVRDEGRSIQLIDYDGMFVPSLQGLTASELGHINFQHPKRQEHHFQGQLDRFSFITLDLALALLIQDPGLWDRTLSDEEGFVFRANDYAKPEHSQTFHSASQVRGLEDHVQRFAQLCGGSFEDIPLPWMFSDPSLALPVSQAVLPAEDRGTAAQVAPLPPPVPTARVEFKPKPKQTRADLSQARAVEEIYVGSYPVVPASQFVRVGHFVGQRIELIGKVVDVRSGKTSFGSSPVLRPYIYLDFLPIAQGKVVRVKVLPEVIESHWGDRKLLPHDGWVGRWVTVSDVVQPVRYINHPAFASGVGEASLHVDHLSQIREIPEAEARFRLAGQNKLVRARVQTRASTQALPVPTHSMPAPVVPAAPSVAQTTLAEPQSKDPDGVVRPAMRSSVDSSARNRAILEKMRSSK
ncbi:MAG: hypothetical protein RL320_1014 [Pseudomonadota bacterium]|jgi:hypothetical protein